MKITTFYLLFILVFTSCKNQNDERIEKINSFKTELDLYIANCESKKSYLDTNEIKELIKHHFSPISFGVFIDSSRLLPKSWNTQSNDSRWFNISKHINDSLEMFSNNSDLKPIYGKITSNYEAFKIRGKSEFFVEYSYLVYLSEEERERIHAHQLGFMTISIIAK